MDKFKNIYEVNKSSGLNDGLHVGRGREGACSVMFLAYLTM